MIKNLKEYKKKKKIFLDLNKHYYDLNRPVVDDASYDTLKKDLINFEENNKDIIGDNKVKNIVGYKPSDKFSKVKHDENMLSLDNAFTDEDISDFYNVTKFYSPIKVFCEEVQLGNALINGYIFVKSGF